MAQRALPAGMVLPRRRAMFGLLDADGWAWASVKALVWTTIIILLLGYIPDRAYYLTVAKTVDLGVIAWSPINLCPPENKNLPCPVPVGGIVPWDASPPELALPQPRTDGAVVQVGTRLLYIGGSDGTTAQASVFVAKTVGTGNFDKWEDGPPLPAPRTDAAVAFVAGSVYVMGGLDADGAPTTTTYVLTPDGTTGELGDWEEAPADLVLPEALSGGAATATADGLLLIGGSNAAGPVATTLKVGLQRGRRPREVGGGTAADRHPDRCDGRGGRRLRLDLRRPRRQRPGRDGPARRLRPGCGRGPAGEPRRGQGRSPGPPMRRRTCRSRAPIPRDGQSTARCTSRVASTRPVSTRRSTGRCPTSTGDIPEWKHLEVSDLPTPLAGGAPVISGPNAVIVGGTTSEGVVGTSYRANIAPQAPFFRLGLVGVTVPGLTIGGEIGQQLGYLNAAGVGTLNFVILIFVGWAYAHKAQARALFARVLRRRP